jgi:hypothetical protein
MLIVDGTYDQLAAANVEQVFYMVPMEGRNDNFDIVGITPAGTAYRCSQAAEPDGFAARFPNAVEVEAFTLT